MPAAAVGRILRMRKPKTPTQTPLAASRLLPAAFCLLPELTKLVAK